MPRLPIDRLNSKMDSTPMDSPTVSSPEKLREESKTLKRCDGVISNLESNLRNVDQDSPPFFQNSSDMNPIHGLHNERQFTFMNEKSKTPQTYQNSRKQLKSSLNNSQQEFKNFHVKKKPNLNHGKTVFNKFSSPSKFSGQKFEFMKGSDGYNVSLYQKVDIDKLDPS